MTKSISIHPVRNLWLAAIVIALIGAVTVQFYGDMEPWIIAIPLIAGAIVVAVIQLAMSKEEFIKLIGDEPAERAITLGQTVDCEGRRENSFPNRIFDGQANNDERNWPVEPEGFIETDPTFEASLTSIINERSKIVLTGQRGTGKTTCAVGLCRKFERMNGASPIKQTPVFISLSQSARSNGLASMFLGQISDQLMVSRPQNYPINAKRSMKAGSVFLVLDDLDYMTESDEHELQKFVKRYNKNAFLCIISDVPQSSFLAEEFVRVEMPEWEPRMVRAYIDRRVPSTAKKTEFLVSLEQVHLLQKAMAPWLANFLVEACLDGTYFKLLSLGELKSDLDYTILDDYLCIMMADSDRSKYLDKIHAFGKLAMKLLKEGKSVFVPEAEGITRDSLNDLMRKLFLRQGDAIAFSHGNYQTFLAGRYIAEFWQEARATLQDAGARILIWKPVYRCAVKFSTATQIKEIDETFERLAK